MSDILFALWFFAPAGIANSMPVFAARIRALDALNKPLDNNKTYRGKRLFGANKTYRGLFIAVVSGIVVAGLQILIYNHNSWVFSIVNQLDYSNLLILLLGALLGGGAIIGDAVKSFFKRQADVPAGKSWFPFDQIDYILGGVLFSLVYTVLSIKIYLLILCLYFFLHIATVYVGWRLKLRVDPI